MIVKILHDDVTATKVVVDMSDVTHESYVATLDVVVRLHIKRRKVKTKSANLVEREHVVDERLSSSKESFQHGRT
jgi:hypothetical protein